MTTYSLRCRNSACRRRRVSRTHPDDLTVRVRCKGCGGFHGWRIEGREYNQRNLCHCNGPDMIDGRNFPHRVTHPLCDKHPMGRVNQARRRGIPESAILGYRGRAEGPVHFRVLTGERRGLQQEDLLMFGGRPLGADEPCPF